MLRQIRNLKDVVDWDLCTGCGACYYNCDRGGVSLVHVAEAGIRPQFDSEACAKCSKCLSICPGYTVDAKAPAPVEAMYDSNSDVGAVLEVWEGHASDPEVRYKGSSGGVLSALALFCLEREGMKFVLHSGIGEDEPWINKTLMSVNRDQILSRTGSRYAPASPCDGLKKIEESDGPCVFIGKPCDTAAVAMLRTEHKELDHKLGLVLTFFCAGTPSEQGTLDLFKRMDVDASKVTSLRYRGEGWPGHFRVLQGNGTPGKSLTYEESWSRLTGYRPLRCNICPDGLGRLADISCGDAWHKLDNGSDPGRSLVLVRTKRGRDILRRAIAANYVKLTRVHSDAVLSAQTSLLQRRRELFGRLLAMRLLMIPTPKLLNFSLGSAWLRLPLRKKAQTILGTLRRAAVRGWWRRRPAF